MLNWPKGKPYFKDDSEEALKCKTKFFWLTISKTANRKVNSTKRNCSKRKSFTGRHTSTSHLHEMLIEIHENTRTFLWVNKKELFLTYIRVLFCTLKSLPFESNGSWSRIFIIFCLDCEGVGPFLNFVTVHFSDRRL